MISECVITALASMGLRKTITSEKIHVLYVDKVLQCRKGEEEINRDVGQPDLERKGILSHFL